jgi:hypothetical protein
MATIMAIDPGNRDSGWVEFFTDPDAIGGLRIVAFGKEANAVLRARLDVPRENGDCLIIEVPKARGMPTANEEFETCVSAGRFIECWDGEWTMVCRVDVKLHLCRHSRAKDKNVRAALIDRFGGEAHAIGAKQCPRCKGKGWSGRGRPTCPECGGSRWAIPPGPLHGVSGDVWAALAVACYWVDGDRATVQAWTVDPKVNSPA